MSLFTMQDMANEMAEFARGGRSARQKAGDLARAMKLRGRKKGGSRAARAKSIAKKVGAGALLAAGGVGALRYGQTAVGAYRQAAAGGAGKREAAGMAAKAVGSRLKGDAGAVGGYAKRQAGRAADVGRGLASMGTGGAATVGRKVKNRFKKK